MISWLQKLLYRLAVTAPIVIIAVILHCVQVKVISVKSIALLTGSALIVIYHFCFLYFVSKKLPSIDFVPEGIPQEDDKIIIELAVSYMIPFIGWGLNFVPGFNWPAFIVPAVVYVIVLVCLIFINHTVPSPFYWLLCYHFHTVESGGKTYKIVSRKRNYRNSNSIKKIKRVFDDLFLVV